MQSLYTKLKIFHYPKKLRSLPKTVPEILPPIHIRIKPTNVCNHNCQYCAYRVENLQLGQDMRVKDSIPREKMLEIITDLNEMGVRAVTFSGGGEPLYYPFIKEAVRQLSQARIQFAALTNGSRLEGEIAELFAHFATWIRISIDGWDDESYNLYRGLKGREFTRVMNNLESFAKLNGTCYTGVCIIVDRMNVDHIYELVSKAKDCGSHSVKIAPCIVSNDGAENNCYHRPIFQRARDQIERVIADFADVSFEVFDSYHLQLQTFEKKYDWCPMIQILPVIGADLNVYTCHDKAYNLDQGLIGSIQTRRFQQLWFSDKNNFFRIRPSIHCNHHCVANTHNEMILEYLYIDKEHMAFV